MTTPENTDKRHFTPEQVDIFADAALQPQLQFEANNLPQVEQAVAQALSRFFSGDYGRIPPEHRQTAAANEAAGRGIVYGLYPYPDKPNRSILVKYDYDREFDEGRPYCQVWNHYAPAPGE